MKKESGNKWLWVIAIIALVLSIISLIISINNAAQVNLAPRRGTIEYESWQLRCLGNSDFFLEHWAWCMNPANSIIWNSLE